MHGSTEGPISSGPVDRSGGPGSADAFGTPGGRGRSETPVSLEIPGGPGMPSDSNGSAGPHVSGIRNVSGIRGVSEGAGGAPDPRLRALVGDYQGYRLRDFAPGVHVGMPGTALTVIITIDEPIDIPVAPHPEQRSSRWETAANGLTVRPCTIAHNGSQHGVQLALTPWGARMLLGVPTAALGSWLVELTDLVGAHARELRERLSAAVDWPQRFAVLDEILLRRAAAAGADAHAIGPNLGRAWQLLTAGSGQARVADVAADIGWSRRHLGNRFTAEFGITPKEAARLARFEASHRLLRSLVMRSAEAAAGRFDVSIAEVAAVVGYYDQAHMAREWRELAGMPPSAWLELEQFPFVQDPDVVTSTDW